MNAFDAALQTELRLSKSGASPTRALTEIADELGQLWLDYTRSAKGSGQFAMGPVSSLAKAGIAAQRRGVMRPRKKRSPLDGTAFIEEKRRKRANAFAADERR